MATGTVKWFDPDRGFGFISPDDGTADRFVHRSGFGPGVVDLADDDKVSFEFDTSPRGPIATNVAIVEPSGKAPRQRRLDSGYRGSGAPRFSGGYQSTYVDRSEGTIEQGTVQRFDRDRGFGFIRTNTGTDVFVHQSAVGVTVLDVGDEVEFRTVSGPKGLRAEQVRRV